ncbi:hypothetical protein RHOSPDRAFT_32843 [Rhodotorula sp. JG-1b]|nr:hypothetical protein RHOSPDRAFT_32843 [Rhodotorula sp. JG-1b]
MLSLLRPLASSAAATLRSRAPAVRPSFGSWFPPRPLQQQTVLPFSSSAAAWILKTHKGAAKRFKALANGMFKRAKAGRVHLNSNRSMSSTRLNRLGKTAYARPAERRTLRKLLPYA